tara:strand:+ start:104 stop:1588 length:1485 start_codon:yes stop_codon:yes gene_type:complete
MQIYSLKIEKHVLSGLIKHPILFADVERFVSETDFYNDIHRTIFCVIRSILHNGGKIDKVLLAEKIRNLGVSFKDEIDIYTYIEDLAFSQIQPKAVMESSKELLKLRIRREIQDTAKEVQQFVEKAGAKDIDEIIGECDSLYNSKINSYAIEDEPIEVFGELSDIIEERGNEPQEDMGLFTTFKEFNRLYGGLRPGNLYSVVARPGQGKTTWINNLVMKTGQLHDLPVLMLDTEMSTLDIQFRLAASVTNVSTWHLETGNWRKNADLTEKVRKGLSRVNKGKCHHVFVGNKNIDQICSLVRRWHLSVVGRGNPCIISYDYVKLTGEKVGQNWAEHQAIGDKIDKLKKLAEEINAPLITAMQLNRSGENHNRRGGDVTDDSSAISLSDRLQWFSSFVAIFRRKTLDEMALDGEDFGSHKLIPLKTRFQGRNAAGHHDLVRRPDGDGFKYVNNYLSFSIENFDVNEEGSLHDIIETQRERHHPEEENPHDGDEQMV